MSEVPWEQDDEKFLNELDKGYERQKPVRDFFVAEGFDVYMPPLERRKTCEEGLSGKYAKQTDLWVNGYAIEIKNLGTRFTTPESFPFDRPYVDSLRGFTQKANPPLAYVNRSTITGALACIITKDGRQSDWGTRLTWDSLRRCHRMFLNVPKSKFRPIEELVALLRSLPPLTNPR